MGGKHRLRLIHFAPCFAFAGELIQHAAEWRLGMFEVGHHFGPGWDKTVWLLFGGLKAIGFMLTAVVLHRSLRHWRPLPTNAVAPLLLLIGAMAPLYWCHIRLVTGAVGTRPLAAAGLLSADAAIVSMMALSAGFLLRWRDAKRSAGSEP